VSLHAGAQRRELHSLLQIGSDQQGEETYGI